MRVKVYNRKYSYHWRLIFSLNNVPGLWIYNIDKKKWLINIQYNEIVYEYGRSSGRKFLVKKLTYKPLNFSPVLIETEFCNKSECSRFASGGKWTYEFYVESFKLSLWDPLYNPEKESRYLDHFPSQTWLE